MAERRFLLVRLGSLGDIVHTFPAVAGLRESFPAAEIVWLTHPRWVELVASSALATEVWPVDSRDLASVRAVLGKVRGRRWDAGIDYQGLWKAAFLPFLGGVSRRIGFSSSTIREFGVPVLYTERVVCKAAHIAEQNGELSQRAGAENAVGQFALRVCEADVTRVSADVGAAGMGAYVVLSPGGGWRSKCWPAERFGGLCARIRRELGLGCVINYGPGEEALADEVRRASGDGQPIVYDGELGPLTALLQGARCIVGGDTGPLHLAVALGTRAVALFGPTDPARNGPYAVGSAARSIVLRSANAATTYGRSDVTDPSLLELSVEQVLEAVKQVSGAAQ
jgi:lipopolysaccharide heptosyltransferase I